MHKTTSQRARDLAQKARLSLPRLSRVETHARVLITEPRDLVNTPTHARTHACMQTQSHCTHRRTQRACVSVRAYRHQAASNQSCIYSVDSSWRIYIRAHHLDGSLHALVLSARAANLILFTRPRNTHARTQSYVASRHQALTACDVHPNRNGHGGASSSSALHSRLARP